VADRDATTRLWLVYTGLRLVVFAGVAAAIYLVTRLNGFPLLLVALLVSSIASLFLLQSQRQALVESQQRRAEQRAEEKASLRARLDESP
jgi:membrane protein implicated in regulation of membrane protease activity